MWGSLSPGSLCIIPVRYKVGPESHQEAISRLLNITQFGGENSMFNLLPLVRTALRKKALKTVNGNGKCHLEEILKNWRFVCF